MSPCLVQQLFRQKIGKDLDQCLIDEVLFPLLRSRKHGPKELLQDIKLATDTLIITEYLADAGLAHFGVPTFTPIPEYWAYSSPEGELTLDKKLKGKFPFWVLVGQRTSTVRRRKIRNQDWGTIDILNKLRELEYPQMGYKPAYYSEEEEEEEACGETEYEDAYIRLREDESLPPSSWSVEQRSHNHVAIVGRSIFVNNFLDDVIFKGKRLTWEGGVLGWQPCTLPLEPPFQFLCR